MNLTISYTRGDGRVTMLAIAVAPDLTVGQFARELLAMDATRTGEAACEDPTLVLTPLSQGPGIAPRPLDPAVSVENAGVRSGDHVEVVSGASARTSAEAASPVAMVRVVSGPDAGKQFPVCAGSTLIGRDHDAAVALTDALVSARHARLSIGDDIEIIDLGSTHGVMIGGTYVTRAQLVPGDRVVVGDTELEVVRASLPPTDAPTTASIAFTRSPQVLPRLPADEVDIPDPPAKPPTREFPKLALVAPVVMGLTMFMMTGRLISLVFIAMSPLMMIGGFIDQRFQRQRALRDGAAEFEAALAHTETLITHLHAEERAARNAQSPPLGEVIAAAASRAPMLWSRRPEHEGFLTSRLGTGSVTSSLTVNPPTATDTFPELWDEAMRLHRSAGLLNDAPVTADLRVAGSVGIAGDLGAARSVARALLTHIIATHSPMECVVAGFVSPASATQWRWLEWVPHVTSPVSPIQGTHVTQTRAGAQHLLSHLEALVQARSGVDIGAFEPLPRGALDPAASERAAPACVPAVVVVVEDDALAHRRRLIRLADKGPDVNVHVVWIAGALADIPAACRTFVDVGIAVGHVRTGASVQDVALDTLDVATATDVARRMACVEDVGVMVDDSGALPPALSYLDLHGFDAIEGSHHDERWRADALAAGHARRAFTLRTLVGHTGEEPFYLDLRAHGPHALVGGTTGAGKSEFLQSWILGMSAAYSPDRVTFLFVDYKGGSAFADCVKLPHAVGLVTDLTPHLVNRALTSLRAELHHREQLLAAKGAKDLESLERSGDPQTPPALVIVIDEFAALVQEVPAFVDGVVDIAQRGRSLGLHLILATQRPAGVIRDNLRANTNLRIALRMADEADSTDVLGTPAAAHLDSSVPGRTMVRTGPGRIVTFQAAYAGAHSVPGAAAALSVTELALGAAGAWEPPAGAQVSPPDGDTDAARVVAAVRSAAALAKVEWPRRPWLDPLAPTYDLEQLAPGDGQIPVGLLDDPHHQAQRPCYLSWDADGNTAVFGASGAGKSATLRTVAASASLGGDEGPVHIYGIDGGNGGLGLLAPLPNVGDIVNVDDTERVGRLLRQLQAIIDERAGRFALAHADTLTDYRAAVGEPGEARIVLLVDGYGTFQNEYMNEPGRMHLFDQFRQVLADGRSVGVSVVIAADRVGALHSSVHALMTRMLVLRLVDENQYAFLGLRTPPLGADSPPGRAVDLASGKELQVALLGGDGSLRAQATAIDRLAAVLAGRAGWTAPPVPRMPSLVLPEEVPDAVAGLPVIGIESESLAPLGADVNRPFMIAGQGGTGRTTALRWLCSRVARVHPDYRMVLLTQRPSPLVADPWWHATATTVAEASDLLPGLLADLELPAVAEHRYVIVIEALSDVAGSHVDMPLVNAVKLAKRNGHVVIGEAETQAWTSGMLANEIKSARRGLVMAPDQHDGLMLLGTPFPRVDRAAMPPGRGVYVADGRAHVVHVPHLTDELSTDHGAGHRAAMARG